MGGCRGQNNVNYSRGSFLCLAGLLNRIITVLFILAKLGRYITVLPLPLPPLPPPRTMRRTSPVGNDKARLTCVAPQLLPALAAAGSLIAADCEEAEAAVVVVARGGVAGCRVTPHPPAGQRGGSGREEDKKKRGIYYSATPHPRPLTGPLNSTTSLFASVCRPLKIGNPWRRQMDSK